MKYIYILLLSLLISCKGQSQRYISKEVRFYPGIFSQDPIIRTEPITVDVGQFGIVFRSETGTFFVDLVRKDTTIRRDGYLAKYYKGEIDKSSAFVILIYSADKTLLTLSLIVRGTYTYFIFNYETKFLNNEVHGEIFQISSKNI